MEALPLLPKRLDRCLLANSGLNCLPFGFSVELDGAGDSAAVPSVASELGAEEGSVEAGADELEDSSLFSWFLFLRNGSLPLS